MMSETTTNTFNQDSQDTGYQTTSVVNGSNGSNTTSNINSNNNNNNNNNNELANINIFLGGNEVYECRTIKHNTIGSQRVNAQYLKGF